LFIFKKNPRNLPWSLGQVKILKHKNGDSLLFLCDSFKPCFFFKWEQRYGGFNSYDFGWPAMPGDIMEASGEGEIGMLSYQFGLLALDLIILLMEELLHQLIGSLSQYL